MSDDDPVLARYVAEAREHGLEPSSTMLDETTRALELDAVLTSIDYVTQSRGRDLSLLEVGCGNGYTLHAIRERFAELRLNGIDFTPQMVDLAAQRRIESCDIRQGDVRDLGFGPRTFDIVVSERCLINVLDPEEQERAFTELGRVLTDGGYLVLIEAFNDGARNLNRARAELGLPENAVPEFNRWLDEDRFLSWLEGSFAIETGPTLPSRNFLSTHYFISRVLYPAVTKRAVVYNTEFVKFFRGLPPQGDYSPIRLYMLRRLPAPTADP